MRSIGKKGYGFIVVTLVLIFFIAFCVVGTVHGQEDIRRAEKELWYRERETTLLTDTRQYLNEAGFRDSGVTLSRTVDAEGNRSYTFTIHHRKIDCMDENGRQALGEELMGLTKTFADKAQGDKCTFSYSFWTP